MPSGGLPFAVKALVQNVGTAFAVYEAVVHNKPLVERVVTVSGDGVREPQNPRARIGTLFSHLIDFCGGFSTDGPVKLIMRLRLRIQAPHRPPAEVRQDEFDPQEVEAGGKHAC